MTHYNIRLYGVNPTSMFLSTMTRKIEAADLECAAKQARKDQDTMKRIFPELTWRLDRLEEIEAKP